MSFKSFVFGVASLKEQVNLLIYKTNEFKEDGMLQNLKFYKHCLTQIARLISLFLTLSFTKTSKKQQTFRFGRQNSARYVTKTC